MPRVSKKTREEAIELLRCAAGFDSAHGMIDARSWLEPSWGSRRLASDAFDAVWRALVIQWSHVWKIGWATLDLEAAALLEDGWSPGDPVVRL